MFVGNHKDSIIAYIMISYISMKKSQFDEHINVYHFQNSFFVFKKSDSHLSLPSYLFDMGWFDYIIYTCVG